VVWIYGEFTPPFPFWEFKICTFDIAVKKQFITVEIGIVLVHFRGPFSGFVLKRFLAC